MHITVEDVAKRYKLNILTGNIGLNREVKGVYICDLLSWVISNSSENDLWVTVLTNMNVVAVAHLANVACIVIPEGIEVEETTIGKAIEEGIPILSTKMKTYELSKLLGKNI